jgi:HTH-type transcriptional regulator/antitoxin HigA
MQKPLKVKSQFMNIKPIRTAKDHNEALKEISKLMDLNPALGSPKGDRLDVLITLVQAYEAKHFPMELPDPVEAIKFRMEQQGLRPKDLEPMIGKSNRVYEVLNRKRSLTINMIRKLHTELGIPAQSLIKN